MKIQTQLIGLAALSVIAIASAQTTLLNDTFTDNDRTNQALNTSAQWFVSSAAANLTATGGTLNFNTSISGSEFTWAHFAPAATPQSLNVGESLTVSFSFTGTSILSGPGVANIRIALFNSNNSRATADNTTGINAVFNGWRGYVVYNQIGAINTAAYEARERTGSSDTLFAGGATPVLPSGSVANSTANFTSGTPYSISMTVARTVSGVQISSSWGGSSYTAIADTATPFTSFDTFALFNNNDATSAITLDNVLITTTAIPEPSSFAAFAGLGAIGLLASRRRQRKA